MNKVLAAESEMIGTYRMSSTQRKLHQRSLVGNPVLALRDEVEKIAVNQIIMDFDRSWWTIRTKLDAYLDAAENQASAFGEAVEAIDGYTTKCSLNLAEMNNVHVRTEHVDEAAYKQLLDTWYAVVEEVGVMASRMDDVGALYELTRFDARSADAHLESHRTDVCSGTASSKQLVTDAVVKTLKGGFADQIWKQLEAVL